MAQKGLDARPRGLARRRRARVNLIGKRCSDRPARVCAPTVRRVRYKCSLSPLSTLLRLTHEDHLPFFGRIKDKGSLGSTLPIAQLPMVVPSLCVGPGRLLVLAPVTSACLFAVGQARLTFRGYFRHVRLRVFCQFRSRVGSGEVGGNRDFAGWIAGSQSLSNGLHARAGRRGVSTCSRICECRRLHQPKEDEERRRRER
jgi:hypothetical protein